MKTNLLTIPLTVLSFSAIASAQTAIATAGDNAVNTNGNLSYTIGQVFYKMATDGNNTVTEGVQQSYDISEILSISDVDTEFDISIFPNPTTHLINVKLSDVLSVKTSYTLIDLNGKIVTVGETNDQSFQIDLSQLNSATYFLNIATSNNKFKTYKILKQ
ncbi:T9SS type A sorting domain-containing protein [Winogradskyella sp. J14-2]|uniref:T9SS type A sorting domain-containing protein n=1 Tax=Winogradskyella sp. J14-2 TaxID=1936080 RepID=UPI0018DB1608|nr:T9SS type A sorting domain-containing protein [Winogradskyella sp. J14-2]